MISVLEHCVKITNSIVVFLHIICTSIIEHLIKLVLPKCLITNSDLLMDESQMKCQRS